MKLTHFSSHEQDCGRGDGIPQPEAGPFEDWQLGQCGLQARRWRRQNRKQEAGVEDHSKDYQLQ